jgi:hypothetical protein
MSAGVILIMAAILRFAILAQNTHMSRLLLKDKDPLIGLTVRPEVWAVAIIEVSVGLICLIGKNATIQSALLAWLMTIYFVYQFGVSWLNFESQHGPLGRLSDPFHVSSGIIGLITKSIPYYLIIGAYGSLVLHWRSPAPERAAMKARNLTLTVFRLQLWPQALAS